MIAERWRVSLAQPNMLSKTKWSALKTSKTRLSSLYLYACACIYMHIHAHAHIYVTIMIKEGEEIDLKIGGRIWKELAKGDGRGWGRKGESDAILF